LPTIPTVYIEGNHYEEWFDYLDAQEDFLDDAIDGTTATYADFFLAKTDLGKDVSPSFHVARDAYFAAAPFWIDDEVEAAFLEADELDIVCATTAEANATTARLLTRPQRHRWSAASSILKGRCAKQPSKPTQQPRPGNPWG
jgi:hypothetical protein